MNPLIFREYDIRGIVDKDLTDDIVEKIGLACGTYLRRKNKNKISVGGDCRISTERFRKALMKGLMRTGCNIINIGVCTTPVLYFSLFHLKADGGIMITGSHNPSNFNGFKVCVGTDTLYGEEIQNLKKIINSSDYEQGEGTCSSYGIVNDYRDYLIKKFTFNKKLHIAIDAGNGTTGEVILPILEKLGVDVVPLNCEMDGTFPVHHPDPTLPKNLEQIIAVIKNKKLDLGVAFDGDGDRIGAINEKGEIIFGDKLLILYSRDILKNKPGATIISEVKASKYLYEDIKNNGGNGIMWKTGHSVIKAKMKETDAVLAGEVSGHMFFADRYFGYDDAIYAALRLIEIVANSDKKLSQLLEDIPESFVTPEIRIPCSDEVKFKMIDRIKEELHDKFKFIDIDGVRITFDDGWGLVRASNTQPALVMRFEAETKKRLDEIKNFVESMVNGLLENVQ